MNEKVYAIDSGISSAIELFITHGCQPGSCTSLLLQEEFEKAKAHAHPAIRGRLPTDGENGEAGYYTGNNEARDKKWQSHVDYVKDIVPSFVKGENFHTWKGFKNSLTKEIEIEIMAETLSGHKYLTNLYNQYKEHNNAV